jgi:predicted DNA-binding transcriptional regulator
MGRAELQTELDLTRMLFDRLLELVKKGMSAQEMIDEGAMKGLSRTFNDPFRFAYDAHKGFWAHHNGLGGDVL